MVSIPPWFDSNCGREFSFNPAELFQSHLGSIQTFYYAGKEEGIKLFQSHLGSIQTGLSGAGYLYPNPFQSHLGSIQTPPLFNE